MAGYNMISSIDYEAITPWDGCKAIIYSRPRIVKPTLSDTEVLELVIEVPKDKQQVDLGQVLAAGGRKDPSIDGGKIYYGDGTEAFEFGGMEPVDSKAFTHKYDTAGEYTISITGKIGWFLNASSIAPAATEVRKFLKEIRVPEGKTSPIYAMGDMYAFNHAEKLTTVSGNVFEHLGSMVKLTRCFIYCKSLVSIPDALFAPLTKVKDFTSCFYNCTSLSAIPENLFSTCTLVTSFNSCFAYCKNLQSIPEAIFSACPKAVNFYDCFRTCLSVTGNVPRLWETHSKATNHSSCFEGCTKASNYADIPENWK